MQKIFLYSSNYSPALQRMHRYLSGLSLKLQIILLPPGSPFSSPASLELRSNDLLILVAENDQEVEVLLRNRIDYEEFRIILILAQQAAVTSNRYMLLSPRLVAYLDHDLPRVAEYLSNICRIQTVTRQVPHLLRTSFNSKGNLTKRPH
ncbi:hypothetical protein JWJ90_06495 [Desulfobulbus rhabdoformis]|uniref:hypothetical protein n=1 Tax=Desulfobulbus rhabdoformis TaxID=34032 RepID=UPI001962D73C|nr:hypothetical protein [Desulfobulbus rhabdoformis]MBM9613938.1 hypothetical protein [Desulfobulbus rhabdoformis]